MQRPAMPQHSAWRCKALGHPDTPGTPENTKGTPGSMTIGACVPGGKLGPRTSKGAAALVLCARSSGLDVEPRAGACAHVNNVAYCSMGTKLSMVGARPASMADAASTGP